MADPVLYADLDALKKRVGREDDTRDDELTGKLDVASRDVEDDTGRPRFWLDAEPTVRILNPRGRILRTHEGWKLFIPDVGDTTGMVVEVGQGDSWTAITDYETGPDEAEEENWPIEWLLRPLLPWTFTRFQRIRITARFGWPAIPKKIVEATLLRAHRLYGRRDSPEGVAGFGDQGVVRVGRYDPDYDKLISKFMRPGIA